MQNKNMKTDEEIWGQDVHKLHPDKQQMMRKLMYLFVFYASKGSKHAYQELSENYFMELMRDVWGVAGYQISKHKSLWNDLQILYYSKGRKNCLHFANFLELIPTIACYFEPDLALEEGVRSFITHLLKAYEQHVLAEVSGKVLNCRTNVQEDTREFLSKLMGDITLIYKLYFPQELTIRVKNSTLQWSSLESFIQMMKEFQVFPKLISARDLFYIYQEELTMGRSQLLRSTEFSKPIMLEIGEVFTLTKLMHCLIGVAKRTFPKLKDIENDEQFIEGDEKIKVRTLLEYMETVKALNKKKTKFMKERFSFIVLEEHEEKQTTKSVLLKDKVVREPVSKMNFFTLMDKLKF